MQISSQKQIQKNKEQIKITHPTVDYLKFYLYFIYLFRQKNKLFFCIFCICSFHIPKQEELKGGKLYKIINGASFNLIHSVQLYYYSEHV